MARLVFRSALLFFYSCVLALPVVSAQSAAMAPSLAVVRPKYDPQAEQLFETGLSRIWAMAGAGVEGYEAGFALNRVGDHYEIVFAPMTFARNMELRIPVNSVGVTIAVAHTHPNSGDDVPSGEAGQARGHGDVFSPVPNFVVSRSGVWVTDPARHTYRKVSGTDWSQDRHALAAAGVLDILPASTEQPQLYLSDSPPAEAQSPTMNDVTSALHIETLP